MRRQPGVAALQGVDSLAVHLLACAGSRAELRELLQQPGQALLSAVQPVLEAQQCLDALGLLQAARGHSQPALSTWQARVAPPLCLRAGCLVSLRMCAMACRRGCVCVAAVVPAGCKQMPLVQEAVQQQPHGAAAAEEASHAAQHAAEQLSSPEAVAAELCLQHLRWLLQAAPASALAVLKVPPWPSPPFLDTSMCPTAARLR